MGVPGQEARYGLFAKGSARLWQWGYGANPTAYGFGHSWPIHRLYYWRRDHAIVAERVMDPCYAPIVNVLDVTQGGGTGAVEHAAVAALQRALSHTPLHD